MLVGLLLRCRVLTAVFFGAMAVSQNSSFAPDYAEAKVSAARLFNLFDQNSTIDPSSDKGYQPVSLSYYFTDFYSKIFYLVTAYFFDDFPRAKC